MKVRATSKLIDCGARGKYCRERQRDPSKCAPGSFRTGKVGKTRIVVCCPKGKWSKKRSKRGQKACKVGMVAQTILRPKSSPKCVEACGV